MNDYRRTPASPPDEAHKPATRFFGWRGGGIVLLGDFHDDRWIVTRGWLKADALTDIRRWTFAAPNAFSGQVRRLVLEATGDGPRARACGAEALTWANDVAEQSAS